MGSGGDRYFPGTSPNLEELVRRSKEEADKKRLDGDVNRFLRELLASYERDPDQIREHLEKIQDVLEDEADMEQFLFGGSVAKHTYVDGLSDIDALVILDREDLAGRTPRTVLNAFHKALRDQLTYDAVQSVEKGRLAVTVTYRDGMEIQLLPAIRVGTKVAIASAGAKGWNEINPKAFQRTLTKANQRLDGSLVPTIKLVKSVISGFPRQKRLTGYHIESLCLEAVKGYRGTKTPKALLTHVFDVASKRVLRPIKDVPGQSGAVDSNLGKAHSPNRRIASDALAGVTRRLNAATSVEQWRKIIED